MSVQFDSSQLTATLLARLKRFCFPAGEAAGASVRGIRAEQRGEIRSAPNAKWVGFSATETVDATRSAFCWDARMDGNLITSVSVTDAYEAGHGRLVLRKGPIALRSMSGPEMDKGEIQRYLGYICYCPPILLHHPTLVWNAVDSATLRLRDRADSTGATIDYELGEDGCPVVMRADRPMTVGKQAVMTAWSARGGDFREQGGFRVSNHMEASWRLPAGEFVYVKIDLTKYEWRP